MRQGLDFHPHSRTARWRPGTRFSYSNAGPPIAAYIVEQVTGQVFEEYVQGNVLDPLGMTTASFLFSDAVREQLATLYVGGVRPEPYWHLSLRPSGSVNASARDMSRFVQMLLNRGELEGARIVSETSMRRMETPATTLGAEMGMEKGYGLANYSAGARGYGFQGHDGGMPGGVASLGYLPEYGLGYVLMVNSDDGNATRRIVRLTRNYLTKDLEPPTLPAGQVMSTATAEKFEGVYRIVTVRPEIMRFWLRLITVVRLSIDGERITLTSLLGINPVDLEYVVLSDQLARRADDPASSLALLGSVGGETQIEIAMAGTFVKVPAGLAWLELGLAITSLALMFSALVFALVWGPRRLFGKLKGEPGIGVRAWPLLTVVILLAASMLPWIGAEIDFRSNFAAPSVYSVGYAMLSVVFFAAACWSVFVLWRARGLPINKIARWHSVAVMAANVLVAGYFLYWGLIGLRIWSL